MINLAMENVAPLEKIAFLIIIDGLYFALYTVSSRWLEATNVSICLITWNQGYIFLSREYGQGEHENKRDMLVLKCYEG